MAESYSGTVECFQDLTEAREAVCAGLAPIVSGHI